MYPVHTKNATPAISNSSGLKIVFEETRFRDGSIGGPSGVEINTVFKFLRQSVDGAWNWSRFLADYFSSIVFTLFFQSSLVKKIMDWVDAYIRNSKVTLR